MEGRHWSSGEFPTAPDGDTDAISDHLSRHGFVKVTGLVDLKRIASARDEVTQVLQNKNAEAPDWRDLTLSGPVQDLARGDWLQAKLSRLFGKRALAETATYVRAVNRGGSRVHIDAARQHGPTARVLKVWIPLGEVIAGEGSLFFIPDPSRPAGAVLGAPSKVADQWEVVTALEALGLKPWLEKTQRMLSSVDCRPGDALIFDGVTLHGSFDKPENGDFRVSVDTGWQADVLAAQGFVGATCEDEDSYRRFVGSPSSWA